MLREFPVDWRLLIAILAEAFSFQPSELLEFDADDLIFWTERLTELRKFQKKASDELKKIR